MSEGDPILGYGLPAARRFGARWIAVASIAAAVCGFPLGVATSIWLGMHASAVSHQSSERGGFMVFALGQGVAAALAVLAILFSREERRTTNRWRWLYWTATVLGTIGVVAVLSLIWFGKIK